ncbi:hypothetical protein F2Q69_00006706 [Brassica cretica]|uniref:Uncharacterized protein n=1 Tax=Brassica cretica TaxID=69181 RepID=A0A8S9NRG5_BRACR|nr:hypothetical protein F2Q69_00006706 [Brassica cretica]
MAFSQVEGAEFCRLARPFIAIIASRIVLLLALYCSLSSPNPSDRTNQTNLAVYRIDLRMSTDSRARLDLGREESEDDRAFSLLACLVYPDERAIDLASVDHMMDLSYPYFSKARILQLSEDLIHARTRLVREEHPMDYTDRPVCVLLPYRHEPDQPG